MRRTSHLWQTVGLLVGGLCLGPFSITPAMAAPVTYTFTGVLTGIDSVPTPPQPLNTPAPLSKASHAKKRYMTQLVGSNRHTTNIGSPVQVNIGAYQVHLPSSAPDQRSDISIPGFLKTTHLSSTQDDLTLTPSASVRSWLSQSSFVTLREPPSTVTTTTWAGPSELPPNIGAFSYSSRLRLPFHSEAAPPNPATIAQGTIAPAAASPLPASLIIAGIGLVALIGLGAGGLRQN